MRLFSNVFILKLLQNVFFSLSLGSIRRCEKEGEEIFIPNITDNPCIYCFCKVGQHVCTAKKKQHQKFWCFSKPFHYWYILYIVPVFFSPVYKNKHTHIVFIMVSKNRLRHVYVHHKAFIHMMVCCITKIHCCFELDVLKSLCFLCFALWNTFDNAKHNVWKH